MDFYITMYKRTIKKGKYVNKVPSVYLQGCYYLGSHRRLRPKTYPSLFGQNKKFDNNYYYILKVFMLYL